MQEGSLFSTSSLAFTVCGFFDDGHSDWCEVRAHTIIVRMCVLKPLQSCPTLCDPIDCSLLGSSVHGILQARKNTGVRSTPFSRRSSQPRDQTSSLTSPTLAGSFFTTSRFFFGEAPYNRILYSYLKLCCIRIIKTWSNIHVI